MVSFSEEEHDSLLHLGIRRKSGRYPWGSGSDPYQRSLGAKSYIDNLKSKGFTDKQICDALSKYAGVKIPTTELRAVIAVSTEMIRGENQAMATRLKEKGLSNGAIAERMGLGSGKSAESTVRGWLKNSETIKENSLRATADALKEHLTNKPFLDVGKGQNLYMGITGTKLNTALAMLEDEGFVVHSFKSPQITSTDKMTNLKVLTKEGVTWAEARKAVLVDGKLQTITAQSDDGGLHFTVPKDAPVSVSSKRIDVRYGKDGGSTMDGVIELRRGVSDLDLGSSRYAQVRVAVDGTHYLKGMAMYADDLPHGIDVRFNSSKQDTGNKYDAMKPLKTTKDGNVDTNNAFGATVHPRTYLDKSGKEKTSPLNIVNEEGSWDDWSRTLSSQMLSKQPVQFATRQLEKAHGYKETELNVIKSLTNPVVKKKLLEEFADSADSDAVHLAAAAMDRQSTHVILPINSIRPHEIYAPNFNNGERVALVRYPHSGPFEIPELTVNNKNADARRILGANPRDAVGIHHTVAQKLSGADFDGDAVAVIPNDAGHVKSRPSLTNLKDFDPKEHYKIPEGDTTIKRMTKENTQSEMGRISNLITDMSIHGASDDEMARAVRHSMVVIDAEKHGLNYKQSSIDNNINDLKSRYQGVPGSKNRGASTLISRASAEQHVPQRKLSTIRDNNAPPINPKTGEKVFVLTGAKRVIPAKIDPDTGLEITKAKVIEKKSKVTRMEFVKDARELVSGDPKTPLSERGTAMEKAYAAHANSMKALGNDARKESVALVMPKLQGAAKAVYSKEITSLNTKLVTAQRNAPLERRAGVLANSMAKQKIDDNPGLTKDDIKKIRYQSLRDARELTGAGKIKIHIEDREWEAIQSGAVSSSRLREILNNADMKRVRVLATPSSRRAVTPGQLARIKQMQASGKPMSEIASQLGIPRSTIIDNLNR